MYPEGGVLAGFAPEFASLAFAHAAPDAESFVVGEGVVEAFAANLAAVADAFGFSGASAFFGEEGFGVGLCAECVGLPGECVVVVSTADAGNPEEYRVDEPVGGNLSAAAEAARSVG